VIANAPAPRTATWRADRIFYSGMALVAVATVFAGFARTYFLRPYFHPEPLSLLPRLHGLAFTTWIALFVAQTTLVAARRTDVHRRLGWAGGALAAIMIVVTWFTAVAAVHQAVLVGNASLARAFFAIPLADILVFGALVGAAFVCRRRPETHKRLMLLATLAILDAATSRWPLKFIESTKYGYDVALDVIIIAAVGYDVLSRRTLDRVYAWGVTLVIGMQILRELVGPTAPWQEFARHFVG
jgi:hypothetical protein